MKWFLDKNYFDKIRNKTQDAINYAIQNHQELLDKALAKTEQIRYSKTVSGLGRWCPFYTMRDEDASFPLFDSPKRFKGGDYTAYHLDQSGNLLLLRQYFQEQLSSDYIFFEREGITYAVLLQSAVQNGHLDHFATYGMITTKDGQPQDSFGVNNMIIWGEHLDWHEPSGEGFFLCTSYLYPVFNPQAPGQPAYEMSRQRFIVKQNHVDEIVPEIKKKVFSL